MRLIPQETQLFSFNTIAVGNLLIKHVLTCSDSVPFELNYSRLRVKCHLARSDFSSYGHIYTKNPVHIARAVTNSRATTCQLSVSSQLTQLTYIMNQCNN